MRFNGVRAFYVENIFHSSAGAALGQGLSIHRKIWTGSIKAAHSNHSGERLRCRQSGEQETAMLTLTRRGNVAETQSEKLPYK